jgi:translation initiation factor 5B
MEKIRSPICVVLGHVDHGKSSILDTIRGTAIVETEAGKITQAIGASIIPLDTVKKVCGDLLTKLNLQFTIPGLLFIDTPGHAAFTNLRRRGGNIADIAVLVVDINEGFKPQTLEAIDILRQYKTPFIVAANKIDLISGFMSAEGNILQIISKQHPQVQAEIEKKMYEIIGKLYEMGFQVERFDRVSDYTKELAIVPCSAKQNIGIPELLMVITGLAQKYLEAHLMHETDGNAKGTILEVKEDKGLGTTIDVIIYSGTLKQDDIIVIGSLDEPIVTKVRALLEPEPLAEMRDKKSKFVNVKEVVAATGVKISAPDLNCVVAGMPLRSSTRENLDKTKEEIQKEISEVLIETDKQGIVIKADTLGSLEALTQLLKEKGIKIRSASIGNISKKDLSDAESNYEKNPLDSVILGFNVSLCPDVAKKDTVEVLLNNVIYRLIEDFEKWQEHEKKMIEAREIEALVRPCKIEFMRNYVFRQNNPAVFGVDVLIGILKTDTPLMKDDGKTLGTVKGLQAENESVNRAEKGKQVAMSIDHVTVGRQVNEGDILYSAIPEEDFRKMKKLTKYLSKEEIMLMKEIADIMRKNNPVWGI